MDLEKAYLHCRRQAFGHYENFPVAGLLLPQPQRNAVAAIYAYARTADDFADEPQYAGQRVRLLKDWMGRLERPAQGNPVFIALADARERFAIPKGLLVDLVQAFLQDCRKARYRNFKELQAYCRLSADPIGRLMLRVFEADSAEALRESDAICTALQLTNHWQDLSSDVQSRDRIYLPQDEMKRFGVTDAQLKAGRWTQAMDGLMGLQVSRAEALFAAGESLPKRLGGRLGLQVGLTLLGGRRILEKIRQQGFDTLKARPKLGLGDLPWFAAKVVGGAWQ